ncbi:MAG: ABC transporter permease, partial [Candidatus Poribacteria bacterium]
MVLASIPVLSESRFAALPVVRVQTLLYILTGLSSAVAALIFTARVSTAKADAGMGFELEVITAVVLGGTPITGGRGSLW